MSSGVFGRPGVFYGLSDTPIASKTDEQRLYWEAFILGVAFVALSVGILGIIISTCAILIKHRQIKSRSRKIETEQQLRAISMYDSITVSSLK